MRIWDYLSAVVRARHIRPVLCIDVSSHGGWAELIESMRIDVDYCVTGVYTGNSGASEPLWLAARRRVASPILLGVDYPVQDVWQLEGLDVLSHWRAHRHVSLQIPSQDQVLEAVGDAPSPALAWRLSQYQRVSQVQVEVRLHWLYQSTPSIRPLICNPQW